MHQNKGLDGKKKQYATCALDSTSPKEGEGGEEACGWDMCWLIYFRPTNFVALFLNPGKPCWFCCVNLSVLQFVGGLSCV